MKVTIGELVNELTIYSNIVETSIINGLPFVRALLSTKTNFTKGYLYAVQRNEHIYSVCIDSTDLHGHRYFPTCSLNRSFITESDLVHTWLGDGKFRDTHDHMIKDKSFYDVMTYLYQCLYDYDIIKFNPSSNLAISDLDFRSPKIKGIISTVLASKHYSEDTISNIIDIVNKKREKFVLSPLRSRELACISAKLRDVGVIPSIEDGIITHITFEKKE